MRFLRKNNTSKSIIVISDIHLGAGVLVNGRRNYLEDFHHDKELVDFLEYYSTGENLNREVELIINGDLFDLLAVPFVPYYDDEFWSEKAALEKLKIITAAHPEVMEALAKFVTQKKKKLVYIIGNHDAELILPSLEEYIHELIPGKDSGNFVMVLDPHQEYSPAKGVVIVHGHEYEVAHRFHPKESVVQDKDGMNYFIPPWGSYYVTRVINKFKEERGHVNAVRPIRKFLINGLIYDTLFTIRFLLGTSFYFIMVRIAQFLRQGNKVKDIITDALNELELFQDYEELTQEFFDSRPEVHTLIVGHTHEPVYRASADGNTFINTGTWTRMYHLDFGRQSEGAALTYAQIDLKNDESNAPKNLDIMLNIWKGKHDLPFSEFG
jgi:UDP-2,3-diacylglucosamine pyrophosphatase LpxH